MQPEPNPPLRPFTPGSPPAADVVTLLQQIVALLAAGVPIDLRLTIGVPHGGALSPLRRPCHRFRRGRRLSRRTPRPQSSTCWPAPRSR